MTMTVRVFGSDSAVSFLTSFCSGCLLLVVVTINQKCNALPTFFEADIAGPTCPESEFAGGCTWCYLLNARPHLIVPHLISYRQVAEKKIRNYGDAAYFLKKTYRNRGQSRKKSRHHQHHPRLRPNHLTGLLIPCHNPHPNTTIKTLKTHMPRHRDHRRTGKRTIKTHRLPRNFIQGPMAMDESMSVHLETTTQTYTRSLGIDCIPHDRFLAI